MDAGADHSKLHAQKPTGAQAVALINAASGAAGRRATYLNLKRLLFAVPLTLFFLGVTDAVQVPFVSLTVQERRVSFFLPTLILTFLQRPLLRLLPRFAFSV